MMPIVGDSGGVRLLRRRLKFLAVELAKAVRKADLMRAAHRRCAEELDLAIVEQRSIASTRAAAAREAQVPKVRNGPKLPTGRAKIRVNNGRTSALDSEIAPVERSAGSQKRKELEDKIREIAYAATHLQA